jgi:hypothetical protein
MTPTVILVFLGIGLFAIPNLFGIWHAFHRVFPTPQERLIWVAVCVFVPVIGGVSYLIFGLRRARKWDPAKDGGTPDREDDSNS